MRQLFIFNTIYQTIGSLAAIFLLRDYPLGAADFSFAVFSMLLLEKVEESVMRKALIVFTVFHVLVGIGHYVAFTTTGNQSYLLAVIAHGILGVLFLYFLVQFTISPKEKSENSVKSETLIR